jgi:glutamate-1-semialdehyde 2,1-aminomutase
VMSAVRLARAVTGRRKVVKFDGGYHGHADALLAQAGSGLATLGIPASPGVPKGVTQDTLTISFNDLEGVERLFKRYRDQIAAVLVEPVFANIGVIPPMPGFLQGLRRLTRQSGSLLIFDEVITGFRVGYGGAQVLYGVKPDLTVLGKVIGGGFPVGAYGGPRRIMKQVAPAGPVYQAGTLAGHPVAMSAGLATLEALSVPGFYARLTQVGETLREGLLEAARKKKVPAVVNQIGGLLCLFFSSEEVTNGAKARRIDSRRYARYFQGMLKEGIYLPPSPFEAWFISSAMGTREVAATLRAHTRALHG